MNITSASFKNTLNFKISNLICLFFTKCWKKMNSNAGKENKELLIDELIISE